RSSEIPSLCVVREAVVIVSPLGMDRSRAPAVPGTGGRRRTGAGGALERIFSRTSGESGTRLIRFALVCEWESIPPGDEVGGGRPTVVGALAALFGEAFANADTSSLASGVSTS